MNTGTAGLIRAIQTGRRKLGLDEETYRNLLADVSGGKTSAKELNAYQLKEVLRRLREAGFHTATEPQLLKIRSLWFSMYDEGVVKSRSERSIAAYVRRITGKSTGACGVKDLQRVIETLKSWINRVEDAAARERLLDFLTSLPAASPLPQ
ncbi:regulatory protein GemA [Desulfovibrio piger]|nr:regulatory protein GemA [Desulfovibrio piger]